jgi:hypothetical protein
MSSAPDYDVIVPSRVTDQRDSAIGKPPLLPGVLAGTGAVEVDGRRYTAEHVVIATGADPVVPPIPGLPQLDGVWGTREATGMKDVPRRLLVFGGGPAGVELAQAVRRLGGEAAIVERGERGSSSCSERVPSVPASTAASTCSPSTAATSCAETGCSSRRVADPGAGVSGPRPSGSIRTREDRRRRAPERRGSPMGDRRRHRHLADDERRRGPGRRWSPRTSSASLDRRTTTPSLA